jgi:glutathione S-transferase
MSAIHLTIRENVMLHPLTAIVTCLALFVYFVFMLIAGNARHKFKISAPATVGHPEFERKFRVQQNTVENLVMFLPALWMFSWYLSPVWASGIGLVWVVGRIVYARGYYAEAGRRGPGFGITMLATGILAVGALVGAGMKLWAA